MASKPTKKAKPALKRVGTKSKGVLPRRPCPACGFTCAYYPGTDLQVRHYSNATRQWCDRKPRPNPLQQAQEQFLATEEGQQWFNDTMGGSAIPMPIVNFKTLQVKDLGELADWWRVLAEQDIARTLPKAEEYSAYDLELIGRATVEMYPTSPWELRSDADPAVYAEIGCWWYLLGKIGRAIGAIREGGMPSNDTVQDARIYATMIARIRDCGGWPGTGDR